MDSTETSYFINNPIFVKYSKRFNIGSLKRSKSLNKVYMNERIIEIPYVIESLNGISKDKKILDLGCTESPVPLFVSSLGYNITGFDYRQYPYYHPNLHFVQGNILALPFPDNCFDVVFCISTIEHIGIGYYEDPSLSEEADQKAIDQVYRIMKPGGLLVFSAPYGVSHVSESQRIYDAKALTNLLGKFVVNKIQYYKSSKNDKSQCNYWEEVDQHTAAKIESRDRANCICLVRVKK